jgi:antibiotic biosynthesis monooxygenase (ABM) superfamily enzyme
MPKIRFALVLMLGVYPLVTALQYMLAPFTAGLEIWQRTLLFTPLMVITMMFVMVPFIQKTFAGFINGRSVKP